MRILVIRVDKSLKTLLQEIADKTGRTLSDLVRDFIAVGIGYAEEGKVFLKGAFGLNRAFSKLPIDDERARLSIWVNEEQIKRSMIAFNTTRHSAIRQAIRLGFFMFQSEYLKVSSDKDEVLILKLFRITNLKDETANTALNRLEKTVWPFYSATS
jgi:hypothetical protein